MDKQNFESKDRFPLSTQALTFIQDMVIATARLALIGGDNYILSGCATTGNNVSDGIIVINGEIMPFKGGTITTTITIIEETIPVSANGLTFENARVKRYAKFASGIGVNYYPWASFKPLQTNEQLEEVKATIKYVDDEIAKIQTGSIPAGVIVMWGGREADIPVGWTLCDGKELPNGKRIPDLRGRFVVGYNSTTGSGYTSMGAGSKKTDQFMMTLEMKHMPKHNHGVNAESKEVAQGEYGLMRKSKSGERLTVSGADVTGSGTEPDLVSPPISVAIKMEGGNEAFDIRPPYYVLAFIIKIDVKE